MHSELKIFERLKKIRKALKCSQAAFAKTIGVSQGFYANMESGRYEIKSDYIISLANNYNINPNWLLLNTGDMFGWEPATFDHTPPDGFTFVPLYDVKAAAGAGYINGTENIKDFLAFKTSWIKNILKSVVNDLFLIHSIGDSMEPTLKEGDIILGDKGKITRKSGIYIIKEGSELSIKRLQFLEDSVTVISDNQFYPKYSLKNPEIIGRAVWYGRKIP